MQLLLAFILIASFRVLSSTPAGDSDRVSSLPGWNKLDSNWFSGHVYVGKKEGKALFHHYILIESERSPKKDPVIVWSNGGPGAPSLFGLMVELGPILLTKDGMIRNEFAWTREANLIILNGPPPVGFSYCSPPGPSGDFKSCGEWNDSTTAYYNRFAIQGILEKHPRLKKNDWFFIGESYAGVYIPTLVREVLSFGPKDIKVKGMALGNACMGTDVLCFSDSDYWWRALFLRGHAQVSEKTFAKFEQECRATLSKSIVTDNCKAKLKDLEKEAGYFYEYDVFSECWYDSDFSPPNRYPLQQSLASTIGGDDFCGGDKFLSDFANDPKVRKALHVAVDSVFCSGDNGAGFVYNYGEKDLRPFYLKLAARKDTRILVYSGDTDVAVNVFASQNWTSNLGLKEVSSWRPWTLDGNRAVVGYVTQYEGDFSFVTIRGSGHMVPQFKKKAAFEMLQRFLRGEPLKPYDPKHKSHEVEIALS